MRTQNSVFKCSILEFNKNHDRTGNLTSIESNKNVPFTIKRAYYLYDVPGGAERGGHAHKKLIHLFVAASGCFDVVINDGQNKRVFTLNRPYYGLLVDEGIWIEVINFSSGAICLVLASELYDPDDYIRDYNEYLIYINDNSSHI